MRYSVVLLALFVAGACGDSPTAPTPPPPPPIPTAQLQYAGQWNYTDCGGAVNVTCILEWSIENVGPGCAAETTAVMRLYSSEDTQIGADVSMNSVGGLYSRTIRPDEIVALHSETRVDYNRVIRHAQLANLFPTWTDVRC